MAITLTITASGTNIVSQSDISASKTKQISISTINDTVVNSTDVSLYTYDWYFIDKPSSSSASIDTTVTTNNQTITLNSIDSWCTYRLFVIAKQTSDITNKSEENPLKAIEDHFVNIKVQSDNNNLEKPANFQRNWQSQYNSLVDIVDSDTKRISNIKISSNTTLSLPSNDGSSGQILKTDGNGSLTFASIDLASLESNITLNSLSDVTSTAPSDNQVLSWDNASSEWMPASITEGVPGLTSDGLVDITLSAGYNILPAGTDSNIGSVMSPFANIYADSISIGAEYALPSTDGTLNQFLTTDGAGTLSWAAVSSSSATDKIEEGNTSVEVIDTGSDGSINFKVENTARWKIDKDGYFLPDDESLNFGHYDSYGSANNKQIDNAYVKSLYINGNRIYSSGMTSTDFAINVSDSFGSGIGKVPFYTSSSAETSTSGHITVFKDIAGASSQLLPWKLKLPNTSNSNIAEGDVLAVNAAKDELEWKRTAPMIFSSTYADEWTTVNAWPGSNPSQGNYSGGDGEPIVLFMFKNITGKDIILKKTSLFCYKMYSDAMTWSIVTASDSNALQDIWASASPEQTLSQTNENSGTGIGIGSSDYASSITLDADNWFGLMINSITAGSASDKRFQALFHYDVVQP